MLSWPPLISNTFHAKGTENWFIELPLASIIEENCHAKKVTVVVHAALRTKLIFCASGETTDKVHGFLLASNEQEVLLLPQQNGDPFVSETFAGEDKEFHFEAKQQQFQRFDTTIFLCSEDASMRVSYSSSSGSCKGQADIAVKTTMEEQTASLNTALRAKKKQRREK